MFVSDIAVVCSLFVIFFFFKQKTAYELRISDWSSDVCSSDLGGLALAKSHEVLTYAWKRSIVSPSARVTIARLVSGRLPKEKFLRFRLRFPLRLSVFTLVTFTPKIASTASWISGLEASGCTLKV